LVYVFPFWYVVPRQIWQPCSEDWSRNGLFVFFSAWPAASRRPVARERTSKMATGRRPKTSLQKVKTLVQ
jgi:hypothetical protein